MLQKAKNQFEASYPRIRPILRPAGRLNLQLRAISKSVHARKRDRYAKVIDSNNATESEINR